MDYELNKILNMVYDYCDAIEKCYGAIPKSSNKPLKECLRLELLEYLIYTMREILIKQSLIYLIKKKY